MTLANGGVVMVTTASADRSVTLVVAGSGASLATHVVIDVTGYYLSES